MYCLNFTDGCPFCFVFIDKLTNFYVKHNHQPTNEFLYIPCAELLHPAIPTRNSAILRKSLQRVFIGRFLSLPHSIQSVYKRVYTRTSAGGWINVYFFQFFSFLVLIGNSIVYPLVNKKGSTFFLGAFLWSFFSSLLYIVWDWFWVWMGVMIGWNWMNGEENVCSFFNCKASRLSIIISTAHIT